MTGPPDLCLSLSTMIFLHHRPKPRLQLSANLPSMSSLSYDPVFFHFRSISPTVPY